jgi:hypothetical protein
VPAAAAPPSAAEDLKFTLRLHASDVAPAHSDETAAASPAARSHRRHAGPASASAAASTAASTPVTPSIVADGDDVSDGSSSNVKTVFQAILNALANTIVGRRKCIETFKQPLDTGRCGLLADMFPQRQSPPSVIDVTAGVQAGKYATLAAGVAELTAALAGALAGHPASAATFTDAAALHTELCTLPLLPSSLQTVLQAQRALPLLVEIFFLNFAFRCVGECCALLALLAAQTGSKPARNLVEPFVALPSKRSIPMYYEWIKKEKRVVVDLRSCFAKVLCG